MKMTKRGKDILGLIVVSLVLIAMLASTSCAPAAPEVKILKWGALEPLSGAAAPWGINMNRGAILAAEEFNAKGGLNVGGTIYKIEILEEDDKYTGTEGVAAVTRLIHEEGVRFITGTLASTVILAIQPITEPAKCVITTNAFADVLSADKPYTFRIGVSVLQGTAGVFKAIHDLYPGPKRVVDIFPNDASGWGNADTVKIASDALGWDVVATEFFERGTTDFHPVLTKMLAKNPDIIETGCCPSSVQALIAAQAYEMGYRGLQSGMLIMPKLQAEKGGPGNVGMIGFFATEYTAPWITPEQKELYDRHQANWPGEEMFYQVEIAYIGTTGMFLAIEKAGTLEQPAMIDTWQDLKWDTPVGEASWVDFDHYGYKGIKRQISLPHPITRLNADGSLDLVTFSDLGPTLKEMGITITK